MFLLVVCLTFILSFVHHLVEVLLRDVEQVSYFRTLADIFILLLSGFDVEPPETTLGWITAFLILMVNILFIGTVIQGIGEAIFKSTGRRRSGMSRTSFKNHTVVFGLNRHSRAILDLYLKNVDQYQTQVVLVDDSIEELPPAYAAEPEWIYFIRGNPLNDDTLERANLKHARSAIICSRLAYEHFAAEADSYAILIALAVECYNSEVVTTLVLRDRNSRIFLEESIKHGKIDVEVDQLICPDEIIENLTANAALNPGLAEFILDVVSYEEKQSKPAGEVGAFHDDNIIVVQDLPDDLFDDGGWRQKEMSFRNVVDRFLEKTGGLILGFQGTRGQEIIPTQPIVVGSRQVLVLKKE